MTHRSDFRLLHRLRVRWAEVDMQAIVFNAHYLMYMDVAITEYWRASALPFAECMHALEGDMVVRKATVDFIHSAKMDDVLDIGMRFVKAGRSSLVFEAAVFRGQALLATGELLYVFTTPHATASQAVPQALRDALEAFEARERMTHLQTGHWAALESLAMPLRQAVFTREQSVPAEMLSDEKDAHAYHAALTNRLGLTLATGRLVFLSEHRAHIGRMAVLQALRNQQLGQQVLLHLLQHAREQGVMEVSLHAQVAACSFYARQGFVPHGPVFQEAGLAHQTMVLSWHMAAGQNAATVVN
jgi:YbgC/YbaW family acyl-CoA thioester hydrolase